jgi:hypothetical protein
MKRIAKVAAGCAATAGLAFAGTGMAGAATLAPASAPTQQSNCLVTTLTGALNDPVGTLTGALQDPIGTVSGTVGCVVSLL